MDKHNSSPYRTYSLSKIEAPRKVPKTSTDSSVKISKSDLRGGKKK